MAGPGFPPDARCTEDPVDVLTTEDAASMIMVPPPSPSIKKRPKLKGDVSLAESASASYATTLPVTSGSGSIARKGFREAPRNSTAVRTGIC